MLNVTVAESGKLHSELSLRVFGVSRHLEKALGITFLQYYSCMASISAFIVPRHIIRHIIITSVNALVLIN